MPVERLILFAAAAWTLLALPGVVACTIEEPSRHRVAVAVEAPTEDSPVAWTRSTPEPITICVNELVPAALASGVHPDGAASDWVELHNPTAEAVELDGWSVTDDPEDPRKHPLRGGLVLEPGGFLVLWADDAPERGPEHLGFVLSADGEAFGLFSPEGSGAVVHFPAISHDLALARTSDCCAGDGCLAYVFGGTPGRTNTP